MAAETNWPRRAGLGTIALVESFRPQRAQQPEIRPRNRAARIAGFDMVRNCLGLVADELVGVADRNQLMVFGWIAGASRCSSLEKASLATGVSGAWTRDFSTVSPGSHRNDDARADRICAGIRNATASDTDNEWADRDASGVRRTRAPNTFARTFCFRANTTYRGLDSERQLPFVDGVNRLRSA